jgi:hypothetical protein
MMNSKQETNIHEKVAYHLDILDDCRYDPNHDDALRYYSQLQPCKMVAAMLLSPLFFVHSL